MQALVTNAARHRAKGAPLAVRVSERGLRSLDTHAQAAAAALQPIPSGSSSEGATGESAGGATAAERRAVSAMQLDLWVPCLKVSLWDDERQRLMGSSPTLAPSTSTPAASASTPAAAAPAAQEALCLYVDDLALSVGQQRTSSRGRSVAEWNVLLAARSLQLDSHLPGSSHPVLCRSQVGTGHGAASVQGDPLPLNLELEVSCLLCGNQLAPASPA